MYTLDEINICICTASCANVHSNATKLTTAKYRTTISVWKHGRRRCTHDALFP